MVILSQGCRDLSIRTMQKVVRNSSVPFRTQGSVCGPSTPPDHPLRSALISQALSSSNNLILSSLEQPLRHLVLLDDVDVCAPAGQGISVHGVQQGLGYGLEQLVRFLDNTPGLARHVTFRPRGSGRGGGGYVSSNAPDPAPTGSHTCRRAAPSRSRSR